MKARSLAALMSTVVALGGARLNLGIAWHERVWIGRARPRAVARYFTPEQVRTQPARRRSRSRWNA